MKKILRRRGLIRPIKPARLFKKPTGNSQWQVDKKLPKARGALGSFLTYCILFLFLTSGSFCRFSCEFVREGHALILGVEEGDDKRVRLTELKRFTEFFLGAEF